MDMNAAFVGSISESLYDDTPRMIYADWLEDHGEPERAEFIRVQCELEPIRDRYEIDRAAELHGREEDLLRKHQQEWLGRKLTGWDRPFGRSDGAGAEFRRGFVDTVGMPVRTFLGIGAETRQLHPTIRRVVLFRVNGYGERLAACSALEGLPELELACWYSDTDAEAVAASRYLHSLQVLEIWLGRKGALRDGRLNRIMAASNAWPNLRELTLLNPSPETNRRGKRLATEANKIAGRKIAVYRKGYPDLYPLAADFWYLFPGYLPDGRMALANGDHSTSPPTLCVLIFDKKGEFEDILTVSSPEELLGIRADEWFRYKEQIQQHLIDRIGFRPGFVRIRDWRFPYDESGYDSLDWDFSEEIGKLDVENVENPMSYWETDERGFGGDIANRVRSQQYVLGWDRIGDKRGRIHST
jgi:uncharacterized protein (TIGR02996 family)